MAQTLRLVLGCLLALTFVALAQAGKCVPFKNYDELDPAFLQSFVVTGVQRSLCYRMLSKAYSHYWVDDDVLDQITNPEDEYCDYATQLVLDDPVQRMANLFTVSDDEAIPSQPSKLCQQVLVATACLYHFPKCDPADPHPPQTEREKPCSFICDLVNPPVNATEPACDAADLKYLRDYGMDVADSNIMPEFNCTGDKWSTTSDSRTGECVKIQSLGSSYPAPRCEKYTGDFCKGVFGDNTLIYVAPELDQTDLETAITREAWLFNVLPYAINPLEEPSRASVLSNLCMNVFPECVAATVPIRPPGTKNETKITRAFPLRPDWDVCLDYRADFSETPFWLYLKENTATAQLPVCENRAVGYNKCLKSQALMPNYIAKYDFLSVPLETPNKDMVIEGYSYASNYLRNVQDLPYSECPAPLVIPDTLAFIDEINNNNLPTNAIWDSRCARPCPNERYSTQEYKDILQFTRGFSIATLVFTIILLFTFSFFHSQRHKTLIYWLLWSYAPIPLLLLIGSRLSDKDSYDYQCLDNTNLEHFRNFAMFQGLFLIYFNLAFFYWWLINCIDMFMRLILNRQYKRGHRRTRRRNKIFHLFAWGTPLLSIAALILGRYIGYDGSLPFSFAAPDPHMTEEPPNLLWAFVLFPQVLCIVIGFLSVFSVFMYLIRYDIAAQQKIEAQQAQEGDSVGAPDQPKRDKKGKVEVDQLQKMHDTFHKESGVLYKIAQSAKLFSFVIMMVIVYVLELAYIIPFSNNQSRDELALFAMEVCLVTGGHDLTGKATKCELAHRLSPHSINSFVAGQLSPGLILFVLYFVVQTEVIQLYVGLLNRCVNIPWLVQYARDDTDSTGNSTASQSYSMSDQSIESDHHDESYDNDFLSRMKSRDRSRHRDKSRGGRGDKSRRDGESRAPKGNAAYQKKPETLPTGPTATQINQYTVIVNTTERTETGQIVKANKSFFKGMPSNVPKKLEPLAPKNPTAGPTSPKSPGLASPTAAPTSTVGLLPNDELRTTMQYPNSPGLGPRSSMGPGSPNMPGCIELSPLQGQKNYDNNNVGIKNDSSFTGGLNSSLGPASPGADLDDDAIM